MSTRWTRPLAIALGLVALLAANYYLRASLEESPRYLYSFLERFYADKVPVLFEQTPGWRLFLPLRELTGAWVTSTLILTYKLERVLTPAGVWYLYNALAIVAAFGMSWVWFRSAVFSFTFAIAIGFGTQFYHAYAVTGGIASYIVTVYHLALIFTAGQVIKGAAPRVLWWITLAVSLALNVLGYEGWLDVVAVAVLSAPFVHFGLRRLGLLAEARRVLGVVAVMVAVAIAYIVVKLTLGFGQVQGSESDVIFNHDSPWLMLDDLISNLFTHAYLSVSNFLPPLFVGATAGFQLGAEHAIDAQHGYHQPFLYLVAMNQVFFWRYYAGAAFVVLGYALYRQAMRLRSKPALSTLVPLVCLIMILVPGATHTLIKFRPMNAMPVMTYHVTVGVIGAAAMIAWLLAAAWQSRLNRAAAVALVAATWMILFYGALARPAYLSYMAAQSGLGNGLYPNPMKALVERLGGVYDAPQGLLAYALMPARVDDEIAKARARLLDLPNPLPPVEQWPPTSDEIVVTPSRQGGLDVSGDRTQFGYQLVSPPIPVRAESTYLMRVKFEVDDGRVCAGILSGDQQRWIVPPDGATVEFLFRSGAMDSVRVVLANCYVLDTGNPKSRFRAIGGSYATLDEVGPK